MTKSPYDFDAFFSRTNQAAITLIGTAGDDTHVVTNTTTVIIEEIGGGTDVAETSANYTLPDNVENITITGGTALTATGNSLSNVLTSNNAASTLKGLAGDDKYVVSNAATVVTESANAGTDTIESSITTTLPDNVENLTLTGSAAINGTGNTLANKLTGNSAVNSLTGLAGDDTIDGKAGADTMVGGTGNDTYVVDNSADVVTEASNEGTDLIQSSITYAASTNVENLTLTGTAAINATGNSLANTITGNSGSNSISGGTGADTMVGGDGNDTYVVDNTADVVTEDTSKGTDLIESSVTYTASSNVENLTLTGTTAINATGNTLANTLTGNSAVNSINGGAGADQMIGGDGNDTYVVDNTADVVTEQLNEGSDLIQSSVTYTAPANVELLTLTGSSTINATGNTLANTLTGNSAANSIDGGSGIDILKGEGGNDTYVVDNTQDLIIESANQGTDLIQSAVTYTTPSNVEKLTLTGAAAIHATGNTLANTLTGNSVANTLTGLGGNDTIDGKAGADTMVGGDGNDTYVVDNTADVVTEAAKKGTDLIQSSVTYTASANVENLTLTGTASINATGNTIDNTLTGNSVNNSLDGGAGADTLSGGAGNDTLTGGAGADQFNMSAGSDVVTDFASGTDKVAVNYPGYGGTSGVYQLTDVGSNLRITSTDGYVMTLNNINKANFNEETDISVIGAPTPTPVPVPTPTPTPTPAPAPTPTPTPTECQGGSCTAENANGSVEISESQLNNVSFETTGNTTTITAESSISKIDVTVEKNVVIDGEALKKPTFTLSGNKTSKLTIENGKTVGASITTETGKNKIKFSGDVAKSPDIEGDFGKDIVTIQQGSKLTGKATMDLGGNADAVTIKGSINKLTINNGDDNAKDKIKINSSDAIKKKLTLKQFGEEDRLVIEGDVFKYQDIANPDIAADLEDIGIAVDLLDSN